MKKTIVNLGLMLVAFAIGITINNACAGSLENMSDSELRSLVVKMQQDIKALQSEVSDLKSQLAKLSSSGGSGSGFGTYGFVVDGLHFNPSGNVDDILDYTVQKSETKYDNSPQNNIIQEFEHHHVRDSKGRVIQTGYDIYTTRNGERIKTSSTIGTTTYSEKMTVSTSEVQGDGYTTKTEITNHYK